MGRVRTRTGHRARRHLRVRRKVKGNGQRPRLAVFRSLRHIYAQIIDDESGKTVAAASSLDGELGKQRQGRRKTEVSTEVGKLVARRAKEQGVAAVVFDRGGNQYHGRVKALAEAAREGGLSF